MNDSPEFNTPVTHPRIGRRSVALIMLVCIFAGCLPWLSLRHFIQQETYPAEDAILFLLFELGFVGFLFGLASGLIWMASWFDKSWQRYLARATVVILAASALNYAGTYDWLKNLSNTAALALSQCTIFLLLKVPAWRSANAGPDSDNPPRRQFQISDVIVATTCTAGLLAIVQNYVTPISADDYWSVTIAICLVFPSIATAVHFAILKPRDSTKFAMGAMAIALTGLSAVGLAVAQIKTDPISMSLWEVTRFYLAFQVSYLATLVVFSAAGRFQAVQNRSFPTPAVKRPSHANDSFDGGL